MAESKFNMEKEYKSLKYSLPDFKKLDYEFEISAIQGLDSNKFLLRQVRRKVVEKVIFFCRLIETVLYPAQPNVITAVESKAFSDEEKQEMSNLYKELMSFERESIYLDAAEDEKQTVECINKIFKFWPKARKQMQEITKKMQNAWSEEEVPTEKNSYTF